MSKINSNQINKENLEQSNNKTVPEQKDNQKQNLVFEQELLITSLNHTGEGMAKIDGKIVFIEKALPGDIVEIETLKDYGNYYKAKLKKIKKSSPNRIEVTCPYYSKCGGCQLLGLSLQDQCTYKKEKVKNIFQKYANLDINPSIISGESYHYRNKITLQVENGQIGLYESNSNTIVSIQECLLISPRMNEVIQIISQEIDLQGLTQIMIRETNNQLMIQLIGNTRKELVLKKISNQVDSIYINDNLIYGLPKIEERLGKYRFEISPKSFFQVNHNQTIKLYNQVKKYLGLSNNNVLDLYCGTGTIGIYVSDCCKKITGIELNPSSVADAKKNIEKNHLKNVQVRQGDVGKVLQIGEQYDAIIVDPPRSGLDKQTKRTLLQIASPKIIYISCNPITLARDIKDLNSKYQLEDITLFDLFPNTYHVESVSLLCLKGQ